MSMFVLQGTRDMLEEEQHIKDGVSRVLVELIKREWPQLWDNLFSDLNALCQNGVRTYAFIDCEKVKKSLTFVVWHQPALVVHPA